MLRSSAGCDRAGFKIGTYFNASRHVTHHGLKPNLFTYHMGWSVDMVTDKNRLHC
jgi:hypothetical protein